MFLTLEAIKRNLIAHLSHGTGTKGISLKSGKCYFCVAVHLTGTRAVLYNERIALWWVDIVSV